MSNRHRKENRSLATTGLDVTMTDLVQQTGPLADNLATTAQRAVRAEHKLRSAAHWWPAKHRG